MSPHRIYEGTYGSVEASQQPTEGHESREASHKMAEGQQASMEPLQRLIRSPVRNRSRSPQRGLGLGRSNSLPSQPKVVPSVVRPTFQTVNHAGEKRSMPSHPMESPAKKQSKWSPDEDALIIELRGGGMKWEDISKRLPGRSAISCRLHYQNYLERRSEWDEERKNKLARLYERFKAEMWSKIAEEMLVPWRAAEAMHWQIGEEEMARRAGVVPFSLSTPSEGHSHSPRAVCRQPHGVVHEHMTHTPPESGPAYANLHSAQGFLPGRSAGIVRRSPPNQGRHRPPSRTPSTSAVSARYTQRLPLAYSYIPPPPTQSPMVISSAGGRPPQAEYHLPPCPNTNIPRKMLLPMPTGLSSNNGASPDVLKGPAIALINSPDSENNPGGGMESPGRLPPILSQTPGNTAPGYSPVDPYAVRHAFSGTNVSYLRPGYPSDPRTWERATFDEVEGRREQRPAGEPPPKTWAEGSNQPPARSWDRPTEGQRVPGWEVQAPESLDSDNWNRPDK